TPFKALYGRDPPQMVRTKGQSTQGSADYEVSR
ncbi:hypothetical protein A2U01_0111410, partial [Trifolium medium]|nr:hypothetical protein [Trifolium medium]